MLRLFFRGCWLLVLLLSTGFGPPVLTDGGYPPVRLGPDEVAALAQQGEPPPVSAASAVVVDVDSGAALYALNADIPRPPASTVKVMTALVVLQQADVREQVVISANAAAAEGSRMGLVAGERLSVFDLLYGLLLPSGNDAAVALAEHVAGGEAAFVAQMNLEAARLGLSQTRFVNPHGLDAAGQYTSAADLVKITRAALAYPAFAEIVRTSRARIAGRELTNTNELLGNYAAADGVKTGTTDAAGECLIASISRRGHRLLAVVLGSQDRYADARALLDYAQAGWRWGPTTLPDNALAWEVGPQARLYRLRSAAIFDIFLPTWQWPLLQPVRRIDSTVPFTGTVPVGQLEWRLGDAVVATVPLTVVQGP
ncbi:MAG: D-alanyl-D-alanine carboxypeptidase family protein [Anaerolineae bacterium]